MPELHDHSAEILHLLKSGNKVGYREHLPSRSLSTAINDIRKAGFTVLGEWQDDPDTPTRTKVYWMELET